MSVLLPKRMDTLVASFGGVGTTFLLEFLARHRITNDHNDGDHLKHLPVPPVSLNARFRCVYVFGDPVLAAVSLFQRNMQHAHSVKLLRHRRDLSPIPEGMTLEAYARASADRFRFRDHCENWRQRYTVHPTLFLRYEQIWDNLDALANFLEVPAVAMEDFPEKHERAARLDALPPETVAGLERMYGSFREELACLPDAEVRGAEFAGKRLHLIKSRNLRLAIGKSANEIYRIRLRNPLSNAIHRSMPRVHAAIAKVRRRVAGD